MSKDKCLYCLNTGGFTARSTQVHVLGQPRDALPELRAAVPDPAGADARGHRPHAAGTDNDPCTTPPMHNDYALAMHNMPDGHAWPCASNAY